MSRKEKTIRLLQGLIYRYRDDDVPALAAQLTYYLILSFFPLLLFIVSVLGFVRLSGQGFVAQFIAMLPADTAASVGRILREAQSSRSGALLSIGGIATIWSASNGINAIIKGLNKAYDEAEDRPFWKVRGVSLLATLVLALMIILAMALLVFGQAIGEYVFRLLDYPTGFDFTWSIVKYVIPVAAMIVAFALLYWMTPNRRLKVREVLPGSVFATMGWIVTSILFQFYINNFGNYTKTYGSLGGVIVLLLWLYISSSIIILGGEINATLAFGRDGADRKLGKQFGPPMPLLKRLMGAAKQGDQDGAARRPESLSGSGAGPAARSGGSSMGGTKFS